MLLIEAFLWLTKVLYPGVRWPQSTPITNTSPYRVILLLTMKYPQTPFTTKPQATWSWDAFYKGSHAMAERKVCCLGKWRGHCVLWSLRLQSPNPQWVCSLFPPPTPSVYLPALVSPEESVCSCLLNASSPYLSCLEKEICLGDDQRPALAFALWVSNESKERQNQTPLACGLSICLLGRKCQESP